MCDGRDGGLILFFLLSCRQRSERQEGVKALIIKKPATPHG